MRHLLAPHTGVQCLNARGVDFTATDLSILLPKLKCVAAVLRLLYCVAELRCAARYLLPWRPLGPCPCGCRTPPLHLLP